LHLGKLANPVLISALTRGKSDFRPVGSVSQSVSDLPLHRICSWVRIRPSSAIILKLILGIPIFVGIAMGVVQQFPLYFGKSKTKSTGQKQKQKQKAKERQNPNKADMWGLVKSRKILL
jgi:flagellar biosynthesis component FlhA